MVRIPLSKRTRIDKYWLIYTVDRKEKKHINLSGCAGNFELITGYISSDEFRPVGWRYEEQGQRCYELFNAGHTVLYAPIKPNLIQTCIYMLSGKRPAQAQRDYLDSFEHALNLGGWKTVKREELNQ